MLPSRSASALASSSGSRQALRVLAATPPSAERRRYLSGISENSAKPSAPSGDDHDAPSNWTSSSSPFPLPSASPSPSASPRSIPSSAPKRKLSQQILDDRFRLPKKSQPAPNAASTRSTSPPPSSSNAASPSIPEEATLDWSRFRKSSKAQLLPTDAVRLRVKQVPAPLLTLEDALKSLAGTVLCTQVVVDSEVERQIDVTVKDPEQVARLRNAGSFSIPPSQKHRTDKFIARDLISGATIPVSFLSFTQAAAFVKGDVINLMNVTLLSNRHVDPPIISLRGNGLSKNYPESWWYVVDPPAAEDDGLVYESIKEIQDGSPERRVNVKVKIVSVVVGREQMISKGGHPYDFSFYREYTVTDASGKTISLSVFLGGEDLPDFEKGDEVELHGVRVRAPGPGTPGVRKKAGLREMRLTGQWHRPREEDGKIWLSNVAARKME